MMNNKQHKGWHSRGYLPHFDDPERIQMISFRLADSLPVSVLKEIDEKYPDQDDERRQRIENYIDAGYGECYLRNPQIAAILEDTLLHFDVERYHLIAWVIMPNHVHVIIECIMGFPLDKIIHSWKSYTANQANKILNRKGRFWQPDYFDRYIRNSESLEGKIIYVHENPVEAGLVQKAEDWPYSSARYI